MNKDKSCDALAKLLADTCILTVKLQNAHWNVVSENFIALHKLFEEQYDALTEAQDVIAERMRALGAGAPATMKAFLEIGRLQEIDIIKDGAQALSLLAQDHRMLSATLTKDLADLDVDDAATIDLLTVRIAEHDKMAWLLESHAS